MPSTPASTTPNPAPPAYVGRSASTGSTTSSHSQSATSLSSSSVSVQDQPSSTADQAEEQPVHRGRRSSISKSIYQGYEDDHHPLGSTSSIPPLPPVLTDMTVSTNIHFEDDAHLNHPAGDHYYSRPSSPTHESSSTPVPLTTTTILEDFHHSHQNHYVVPLPQHQQSQSSSSSSPFAFFANSIVSSASSSPTISEHSATSPSHHFPASATSSKTLRIELAQSEVVLMAGQVTTLEGVLYVNVHKATKVKTLQLEFSGRSSVTWIDGKMLKGEREGGYGGSGGYGGGSSSNSGACSAATATSPPYPKPDRRGAFLFSSQELVPLSDTPSFQQFHTIKKHNRSKSNDLKISIDNAYSPATRHTTAPHIEHTWEFITHQHKQPSVHLQPGQHAYPFALELPDSLPETLTTTHGKVSYRLTATLTKPGFSLHSSTITMPVTILRKYPSHSTRSYQRGGRAVNKPEDKIQYKIVVPQIRVPHSTKVPLQVTITTPSPRIHISVLQVGLWERVVYRADGRRRVDMRLVKIQKSEGWPHETRPGSGANEATTWNKVLLFDMPQMGGTELTHCNPSADNGLMKVTHLLRFSILGVEGTKRFRVESEIDIKVLAFEDEVRHEIFVAEDGTLVDAPVTMMDNELPSYLTSFSTPRVSFDAERDMDPVMANDDMLRSMLAGIHLPTYAESEEDVNSRGTSRDVSRVVSRNASRAPSRGQSPERTPSTSSSHSHHSPNSNHEEGGGSYHPQDGSGLLNVHPHHHSYHIQPHHRGSSPLRSTV